MNWTVSKMKEGRNWEEEQKNVKDKQAFDDVISKSKAAERNAEELKRSSKNKSDTREISQNDLRRDFDKEKPRIKIRNSEGQIRTTDVVESLQGTMCCREIKWSCRETENNPRKGARYILYYCFESIFLTVNTELNFCISI